MISSITGNRQFLTDLFAGPFRGHAIIMDYDATGLPSLQVPEDVVISERPVREWADRSLRHYEARVKWQQAIGDDSVPYARIATGTEIFATAFGSPVHRFDNDTPCAMPFVSTAEEADRIPEPDLTARPLARVFECARLMRDELGPDVPIGGMDIQSPFDIAALIWRKEDLFIAMYEEPEAVKRLVAKCQRLVESFLREFIREFPNCNLCHCPNAWAPPALGCWLSEDEVGSLNTEMFEEFCLPVLTEMSDSFGGLFMHCCAAADHQYQGFRKIPKLRALNRVFQEQHGPRPAVETFAGETVLMMAWFDEAYINRIIDMAQPNSRYLLNMPAMPLDDAKGVFDRLRTRCPRS